MRQKGAQKTTLQFVEPGVDAEAVCDLVAVPAAIAQDDESIAHGGVIHNDSAAIAQATQVLRRIKTVGDVAREGRQGLSIEESAMRLRGVLNERDLVLPGELHEISQRTGLAVQMHRH